MLVNLHDLRKVRHKASIRHSDAGNSRSLRDRKLHNYTSDLFRDEDQERLVEHTVGSMAVSTEQYSLPFAQAARRDGTARQQEEAPRE